MAREEDCIKHEDGTSVEVEVVERMEETWR
jgi:hypothetical protein